SKYQSHTLSNSADIKTVVSLISREVYLKKLNEEKFCIIWFVGIPKKNSNGEKNLVPGETIGSYIRKCNIYISLTKKKARLPISYLLDLSLVSCKSTTRLDLLEFLWDIVGMVDSIKLNLKSIYNRQTLFFLSSISYRLKIETKRISLIKKIIVGVIDKCNKGNSSEEQWKDFCEYIIQKLDHIKCELKAMELAMSEVYPFIDRDDYFVLKSEYCVI
ncbi:hypothetical protein CDIK_4369, partial [Cucumispora dikerogammari]